MVFKAKVIQILWIINNKWSAAFIFGTNLSILEIIGAFKMFWKF